MGNFSNKGKNQTDQEDQSGENNAFTSSNAPPSITPTPLNQQPSRKKPPIQAIILTIIVAAIIIIPIYFVGNIIVDFKSTNDRCHSGGKKLLGRSDEIRKEIDSIDFVPGQPDIKSEVNKNEGDCVDSIPTITLEKTYKNPTMNAGELFDQLTTTLKSKGYSTAYDQSRENKCFGVTYYDDGEDYSDHEDREIRIEIECLGLHSEKKASWRLMKVSELSVETSIRWRGFTNN